MGSSRAGAGGGATLRDIEQRSSAATDAPGHGATTTRRASPRLDLADKKARRRRRARRFLVTSAIIGAGFVAGLIGGMISGIA